MPRRRPKLDEEANALAAARDVAIVDERAFRKAHGVVHTPPAIARTMVRLAAMALGDLASDDLVIVDPSCGPGLFLAAVLDHIPSARRTKVKLVGLDIDDRAIGMAGGLLADACAARGIALDLRATDTIDTDARSFTRDHARVLVIGNPPWAARTPLRGGAASDAMLDAFRVDALGVSLGERKIGVLSDAYVRFFRFCAEVVRRAPKGGALALVTNGSFLDGPVHRGMRGALQRWFDAVDVIDLGGSALLAHDGVRDENVFGVRPTVAITVATRSPARGELSADGRVRYARLRGAKEDKLAALEMPISFVEISPVSPAFVWKPVSRIGNGEASLALDAIFPFHREGVQTNRDRAVVAKDRETLLARLRAFVRGDRHPDLEAAYTKSDHYDPERARAHVAEALTRDEDGTRGIAVRALAYRPFDTHFYAPIAPFCHRPRTDLALAVERAALTLVTVRKDRGEAAWLHFGVVREVPDNCFLSNRSSCRTRAFPSHTADGTGNLHEGAASAFASHIGRAPRSREVVAYVLAVLASASYRDAFGDSLRLEYPEIPLPASAASFLRRVHAGERLASVFLAEPADRPAKIGHYRIENAASGLDEALETAESAFRDHS